jgi:hypothetical protein
MKRQGANNQSAQVSLAVLTIFVLLILGLMILIHSWSGLVLFFIGIIVVLIGSIGGLRDKAGKPSLVLLAAGALLVAAGYYLAHGLLASVLVGVGAVLFVAGAIAFVIAYPWKVF